MDRAVRCSVGQKYGYILIAAEHRGADRAIMISTADHHTGLCSDIGDTAADNKFQGSGGASASGAEGQVIRFR